MARRYQSRAGAVAGAIVGTLIVCALGVGAWVHWEEVSGFFKDIGLMFQIAQEKVEEEKEKNPQESGFIFNDKDTFQEGLFLASYRINADDYAAYDVVETAESAYTITATVEPDNSIQTSLNWSLEWVDASSEWATDKTVTDYVTVSPYGKKDAVISCLQPFGEQIEIKVTLLENTALRATCVCDYVKRLNKINGISFIGDSGSIPVEIDIENNFVYDTGNVENLDTKINTIDVQGDYSAYTIDDDYTVKAYISFTDEFIFDLKTKLSTAIVATVTDKSGDKFYNLEYLWFAKNSLRDTSNESRDAQAVVVLKDFLKKFNIGDIIGSVKIEIIGQYSSFSQEYDLKVGAGWGQVATNVALSDGNLTF